MIIKKSAFIILLALFFVLAANAMPPHPNNKKPAGREKSESLNTAQEPIYKSILKSSPAKTTPLGSRTQMNLLVILAEFGAELTVQTAAAPISGNNNLKKSNYIIPALLLIFLIIQILFRNKKRYILLNAYLLLILSCEEISSLFDPGPGQPLSFQTQNPVSTFKKVLADNPDPSFLTMKKYWHDMSNGKLTLNIDVVGPVKVSKGWQYYGRNNKAGDDSHPEEFVSEAVKLAHSEVLRLNPTNGYAKYDNNGDSYVDTVIVVFAGQGEEQYGTEDAIWSHSFSLSGAKIEPVFLDDVYIDGYTVQPEYNIKPGDATIGVFCHEFAHVLGLPDLYDTIPDLTHGVGSWSLMAAGSWGSSIGEDPAPLLAWERYELGGEDWVKIKPCTKATQTINILDIEESKIAYMIPLNADESQYLLLERKTDALPPKLGGNLGGKFVPAKGILITHINEPIVDKYWRNAKGANSNKVNSYNNRPHGVNIVEADGTGYGGTGVLWDTKNLLESLNDYKKMIFYYNDTKRNKVNLSTPGMDNYFPNSNYYLDETLENKKGSSGVKIEITAEGSFKIN